MCPACAIQLAIKGYLKSPPTQPPFLPESGNLNNYYNITSLMCLSRHGFIVIVSIQAKLSPLAIV